jgi:predicted MFS family arabinose efflux permease
MPSEHTAGAPLQKWVLVGAIYSSSVAPLLVNTVPQVNQILDQSMHIGATALGFFSSADAGGIAVGALIAALTSRFSSPRLTIFAGIFLQMTANLLTTAFDWGLPIFIFRFFGGTGTGLILSTCSYVFGFGNTERNYAGYMLGLMALSALVIPALVVVSGRFGWQGMFALFAAFLIPAIPFVRRFPQRFETTPASPSAAANSPPFLSSVGLAAVTVATIGQIALFTYLGSIGIASGYSTEQIATSLAYSGGGAFLGAAISVAIGRRLSGMFAIALIVTLEVVGIEMAGSHQAWVYTAGITMFFFTIPVYATAQFGMLMRRAPSQSFAVSLSAAQLVGTALAPASGGLIIRNSGYRLLCGFSAGAAVAAYSLLIFYVVIVRSQRARTSKKITVEDNLHVSREVD